MHWSQLIGGDVVISPPHAWQVRLNASGIAAVPRMDDPVDPGMVAELLEKFPDFRRAYTEGGIPVEQFDDYGATRRTLRQFLGAVSDLAALVRDIVVPNPEK
jgi:transaldolase